MEQMEQLWIYMLDDIKADKIDNERRNSPLRQECEGKRAYILEQMDNMKQIEEQVAVISDRKDAIRDAVERSKTHLASLEARFETDCPTDLESTQKLLAEVEKCRRTIISYESEIRRIQKDSTEYDRKRTQITRMITTAKLEFDQKRTQLNVENEKKKAELAAQRKLADSKKQGIPESLLAVYDAVKKQISPPIARLINGQCSGCNTSQPSAALRKIEAGNEIIECETCGRILMK